LALDDECKIAFDLPVRPAGKKSGETPKNSPGARNRARKHGNMLGELPVFRCDRQSMMQESAETGTVRSPLYWGCPRPLKCGPVRGYI